MTPPKYQQQFADSDLEWFKLLHQLFTKEEIGNIRKSLYRTVVIPNSTHESQIRLSHAGDLIWNLAKLVYHERVEALENAGNKHNGLRRTLESRVWVGAVKYRDGLKCRRCGSKIKLESHHIKPVSKYPELLSDIDNGITLCHECHMLFHSRQKRGQP
jgi:hypothetical protein